ncbi:MAG: baseplate J/gp47 family protein [Desulfovibrio sp.]
MQDYSKLFNSMLTESGMPTTEAEMRAEWNKLNEAEGSLIQNDSKWSAFWRLITAIVTTPFMALVKLLVTTVLPNTYLLTASGPWLNMLAKAVDIERKPATPAVGAVQFVRENSMGTLTIPVDTIVETPAINGKIYRVKVTQDTVSDGGQQSVSVPVQAVETGEAYNLGPGYYSILPIPVTGVASVANSGDWLTSAGTNEEKDDPLRQRARNQFSAVGQYHHDAAYTADICAFSGIRPDYVHFEHDAPRGPGTANCFIMIETGVPPQGTIDAINTYINDTGHHGHGDDMQCFPMPTLDVDLVATIHPILNLSADKKEALKTKVENIIRAAFRENTDYEPTKVLPFDRFSLSRLADELHALLPDLASVEFNRGDIISGMKLPKLKTFSVVHGGE